MAMVPAPLNKVEIGGQLIQVLLRKEALKMAILVDFKTPVLEGTEGVWSKAGSREFAVLGDTVNVAFKLAEVTEALAQSVFISQDIAQQLVNTIRMQQVAVVPGEGEADPVEVFAVQI